ncbi:uncharacterized protein ACHE_30393A [Aspergillus chevalieri]|uniref:Uncharacterized protein n=1 Tax=Aspergillus chevalieri TaxID=182096 RepID=A0A7R7ZME2_ASPCH|nr:uncharacterized protein ACHE_30393A [Aspergillus chevalieri]BCR86406.1 hypothetical protein ACHE_30393A [Aspergillus chevalieri]
MSHPPAATVRGKKGPPQALTRESPVLPVGLRYQKHALTQTNCSNSAEIWLAASGLSADP